MRGSGAEEDCTAAVNPFAVVGEAAARAVGGVNNPKHLPVAKHAMRLVAAMLARPESRELVAGPPPLSLEEDGLAAALLSGVAVALSSRQSSSMSSALEVRAASTGRLGKSHAHACPARRGDYMGFSGFLGIWQLSPPLQSLPLVPSILISPPSKSTALAAPPTPGCNLPVIKGSMIEQ